METPQLSNFIQTIIRKLDQGRRANDDVELSDLSYEDALLDVQMRSFFVDEYRDKEPTATAFPRLAHAIRLHEQEQDRRVVASRGGARRLAIQLRQAMAGLYRTGSSAGTSRVLSGALVTALLVLAVGPNVSRLSSEPSGIHDLQDSLGGRAIFARRTTTEPQHTSLSTNLPDAHAQMRHLLEQKTGEDFDASYQMQEVPPLHPAELRLVEKKVGEPQPHYVPEPTQKLTTNGPE